jgi:hypothetical protein
MERLPVKERVVNDVVAGRLVIGAKRVGCAEFAGLNGGGEVGVVVHPQEAVALLGGRAGRDAPATPDGETTRTANSP